MECTRDGGGTWTQASFRLPSGAPFQAVAFANATTAIAVTGFAEIARTDDGGASWSNSTSGTTRSLFGVAFATPDVAVVVGETSIMLRTVTGGFP